MMQLFEYNQINSKSFGLLDVALMTANCPYPFEFVYSVAPSICVFALMSHLRDSLYKC